MNDAKTQRSPLVTCIVHLCALAVAAVFIVAATMKILDPRQFALDIQNYHILPTEHVNLLAITLPWVEIGAALSIVLAQALCLWGWLSPDPAIGSAAATLLPRLVRAGAILMAGMLVMFIGAIGYATLMGYNISCGCFGHGSGKAGIMSMLFDTALLAAAIFAFVFVPGGSPLRRTEESISCVGAPAQDIA